MDALKDTEIQLSLNNNLIQHSTALFADVSTDVTEGRVVLTGSVPTRADKVTATQLAWGTTGVLAVTDELVVAEDSGTVAYAEDAWISNQLRLFAVDRFQHPVAELQCRNGRQGRPRDRSCPLRERAGARAGPCPQCFRGCQGRLACADHRRSAAQHRRRGTHARPAEPGRKTGGGMGLKVAIQMGPDRVRRHRRGQHVPSGRRSPGPRPLAVLLPRRGPGLARRPGPCRWS